MKLLLKVFILVIFTIKVFAFNIASNDDYRIYENDKYSIIFTNDNLNEAKFIKKNLDKFLELNNKLYSYKFDTPLKISLISNNIQVANAFSTQAPTNMAVFYKGGSSLNNYFANTSWLKSLMLHELAHNYQINAKKSKISKYLAKFLGNNFAPIWFTLPFFTLPNAYLPTFILEGNAVLNETLYDNGGRLYNGSLNALKNSLIFSNRVNPVTLINNSLDFPYGEGKYIIGGFYMQYMAHKYGIQKVNSFFYKQSIHSINPFLLKQTYRFHFGATFERTIFDFIEYTKDEYSNYNQIVKKAKATSKSKIYFSNIKDKIYFITSNMKTKKSLNIYDIKTNKFKTTSTTLDNNRLFEINNTLYTSSSNMIDSSSYKHGLFDKSQNILSNTKGKSIQDMRDTSIAYVDINRSFTKAKLYINNKYYSDIVSNALFDKSQNIYYFKQDKTKRVLYKNKTPLISFEGYYSKLIDIKDDEVYFISNSKNGSTIYKYINNSIFKMSSYDNIVNAKIINKNKAIISSVRADNYSINIIDLKEISQDEPFEVYNVKLKEKFKFDDNISFDLSSKSYNSLSQLEYVNTHPTYSSTIDNTIVTLNTVFEDTLKFNKIDLFLFKDKYDTFTSLSYINTRYYINYLLNIYKVSRDEEIENSRNFGSNIMIFSNLYQNANNSVNLYIKQSFDDENKDENPISVTLNHKYSRSYGLAIDYDTLSDIKLIYKNDRDDNIYGIKYNFTKHLVNEFYLNTNFAYLKSNADLDLQEHRGIKVVTNKIYTYSDDTRIIMEGNNGYFYAKDMQKVSIGIKKQINFSKYFSKFPFSLRREIIALKYHQYDFNTYKKFKVKEKEFSIAFDILFGHKFSFPIQVKYITNDHSKDDYKYLFNIGVNY